MLIAFHDFPGSSSFQGATDRFFDDTYLKQCIDDLHAAIVDAKLRNQKGEVRPDIWREGLYPRAATRARTVPLLEKDRERRLGELQEVPLFIPSPMPAYFIFTSRTKTQSCKRKLHPTSINSMKIRKN